MFKTLTNQSIFRLMTGKICNKKKKKEFLPGQHRKLEYRKTDTEKTQKQIISIHYYYIWKLEMTLLCRNK